MANPTRATSPGLQLQPMVHVVDMAAAIDFYSHLGAELIHGGSDTEWTLMQLGTFQIGLLAGPPDEERGETEVELNFAAAMPLDRLQARLQKAGVPVDAATEQLEVRSPDGLLIKINQLEPEDPMEDEDRPLQEHTMKIGIIGAGHIGGNLAELLVQRGHVVSIANSRGPATLSEIAERTGATPVTVTEAPVDADVVIITIPLHAVTALPPGLLTTAKPTAAVIDTTNYYPQRDGQIAAIDAGQPSSAWVSDQIGQPVVKVFNNIYSSELLTRPTAPGTPGRRALPVAGDDEAAMRVVLELVDELGFDAVDVGGLDESWRHEPGTPAYGPDVDSAKLVQLLNEATR